MMNFWLVGKRRWRYDWWQCKMVNIKQWWTHREKEIGGHYVYSSKQYLSENIYYYEPEGCFIYNILLLFPEDILFSSSLLIH